MYAVIKTGGKQYRVQAGDLLVVEKLDGQPGDSVSFGDVLMLGGGEGDVTVGAPLIDGAAVTATLIETRKGEKIKVFKKIRRQGYRRTQGHRQFESVLRVTAVAGGGQESKWDGTVDLTPKSVLDVGALGLLAGAGLGGGLLFGRRGDARTRSFGRGGRREGRPQAPRPQEGRERRRRSRGRSVSASRK
jgi:large subunit ribosomal protein L21